MGSSMLRVYLCATFCVALAVASPRDENPGVVNNRPIIGVLSMEVELAQLSHFGNYTSHIAASYVKFLESSGARVVPIMIYEEPSYYKNITENVNGILIPGALAIDESTLEEEVINSTLASGAGYSLAAAYLYRYALEQNLEGNYLPLWGTSLGFHIVAFNAAGSSLTALGIAKPCSANNLMIPLEFTPEVENSRLFGNAPENILKILSEEKVAANFHNLCVTEETMAEFNLSSTWRILSTNHDLNGMKFVSTIEAIDIPFYATIYHPEKNVFEWIEEEDTPHNSDAVKTMQYFSNFFVDEARKSSNKFPSEEEERDALIYNYNITLTKGSSHYEQVYFFKSSTTPSSSPTIRVRLYDLFRLHGLFHPTILFFVFQHFFSQFLRN